MNIKELNELLKAHGLEAELKDGSVQITEDTLSALAECREEPDRFFVIKCRHMVDITYRVPGTSFEDALEKLCNRELFQEHGQGLFGPSDYVLHEEGIEVVDADCYGDPSATGRGWQQRSWVYHEEDEHGDDWTGNEDLSADMAS